MTPVQEQRDKGYSAREDRQGAEGDQHRQDSTFPNSLTVPEQGTAVTSPLTIPDKVKRCVRSENPIESSRR